MALIFLFLDVVDGPFVDERECDTKWKEPDENGKPDDVGQTLRYMIDVGEDELEPNKEREQHDVENRQV